MHIRQLFALPLIGMATVSGAAIGDPMTAQLEHSITKRACYVGGLTWGNEVGVALGNVDLACKNKFQGHYKGNSEYSACYDLKQGKHVRFTVKRLSSFEGDLSFDDCKTNLRLEIVGCSHGGSSNHGNWNFQSDPNSGSC